MIEVAISPDEGWGGGTDWLALARLARQHDIPEQHLAIIAVGERVEQVALHHRKGQDIGRLVLLAIGRVQALDLGVVGFLDLDDPAHSEQAVHGGRPHTLRDRRLAQGREKGVEHLAIDPHTG